jgi:hypothetical protein
VQTLFTTGQAQARLALSRATLYRLHDAGILPAVEVVRRGRKRILRWRPETLEEFIHDCEQRVPGKDKQP